VINNFEHVPTAAPAIATILETSPDVKVLAISRALPSLRWECEILIPSPALPDPARRASLE
jgi:hypothetical protein